MTTPGARRGGAAGDARVSAARRRWLPLGAWALLSAAGCNDATLGEGQSEAYVRDAKTAILIAEAVWRPRYGERIEKSRPFVATLKGGVWFVSGTPAAQLSEGAPVAQILARDGRILRLGYSR